MYEIRLFGSGQALYDGKAIPGFPGQQHCHLFYYLLLNRQSSQTREQVATQFWGDSPSPVARKNLRNVLWRLNQSFQAVGAAFEDVIFTEGEYLSIRNNGQYQLDIDHFEKAICYSQHPSNQALTNDQASLLEEAVDLYKGDLLEGVYEDWCIYERERLRLAFINMLIKLLDHHVNKCNYVHGLEYGQRILALDSTHERIHRQVMMIYWMTGDREAALQQYRSCCEILQRELGLKPMGETQQLYESICRTLTVPNGSELRKIETSNQRVISPSIGQMLQKLRFLEMIVDHTNTELHVLEQMIQQVLEVH